ncbi:MAG: 16S rRNA (uracil(1498)-N(3))-methyltransferase [Kiritimatiellae bacterium]|nr:16S rRNA (uracil(1498)-N(3))-methyltransferase [Kiritimatiellia bacterium]
MNLLLLKRTELSDDSTLTLRDKRAEHLIRVLRVSSGDHVRVGLLNGPRGTGRVESVASDQVVLRCAFEDAPPPVSRLDLILALPRPKVMKRLWAQLAALGVGRIILTNAARVERNYFDTHVIDPDFYTPLLIEGLQQAQDTHLPEVSLQRRFKLLIEDDLATLSDAPLRFVAHPTAKTSVAEISHSASGRVLLAIGPEGGWVPFELELLAEHGFTAVHFGARTLRSDTACIAAIATVTQFLMP